MRRVLPALALIAPVAHAVPLTLHHQGRVVDDEALPLDGPFDVTVGLYETPTATSPTWSQTWTDVPFDRGYFHVLLGDDGSLDVDTFAADELWLELRVDGNPSGERVPLSSVPYALRADTAFNAIGGVIDAAEIRVDGATVIDGDGRVSASSLAIGGQTVIDAAGALDVTEVRVGGATVIGSDGGLVSGTTLDALSCVTGGVPQWDGAEWTCPALDGGAIAALLTAGPVALQPGSTVGGEAIATGPHTVDTRLSEAEVEAYVTDEPIDLAAGSRVDGAAISTGPHTTSLPWTAITGRPATLGGLTGCLGGAIPRLVGAAWTCGADADTVGGLSCDAGEVAQWDGARWTCGALGVLEGELWLPPTRLVGTTSTAGTGAGGQTGPTALTTRGATVSIDGTVVSLGTAAGTTGPTALSTEAGGGATTSATALTTGDSSGTSGATAPTTAGAGGHNHPMGAARKYSGYVGYCNGVPDSSFSFCTSSAGNWTEIRTDSAMVTYLRTEAVGDHAHIVAAHTHSLPAHNHAVAAHTHTVAAHSHTIAAHTHALPEHTHTAASHSHTNAAHAHDIAAHTHAGFAHDHTIELRLPAEGWVAFPRPIPGATREWIRLSDPRDLEGNPAAVPPAAEVLFANALGFAYRADTGDAGVLMRWSARQP